MINTNDLIRACAADYPVTCASGKVRLQSELRAAFSMVEDDQNWKEPICAVISEGADLNVLSDAVIHFTGSVPSFRPLINCQILVEAAGYYVAVGS